MSTVSALTPMISVMIHAMFSLPGLYVILRFIWPLPLARHARLALALLVLLASQFHAVNRWVSGSPLDPEMPWSMVVAFNVAFATVLLLAVLQLLLDLRALIWSAMQRRVRHIEPRVRVAIAVMAMLLAGIGVHQAIALPEVRDVEVPITGLPPAFEGYRIVQLSDLHITPLFNAQWVRQVVELTNQQGADLVLVTGDVFDGTVAQRRDDVAALADLRATDGVIMSPGNHEYYFGYDEWMAHLRSLGMRTLENAHEVLSRGDAQLVIAGVTDRTAARMGLPEPNVAEALRNAPAGAPIVLLDHQPRQARAAAAQGVALQLSGHTHGGLVLGLNYAVAMANGGFVAGRYDIDDTVLYVSSGTALWPGFALRLGTRNEITRITLVSRN